MTKSGIARLIILILLVTMFIELINCVIIVKQNKKYQDKVNIIITNIVGEISQNYPEINDEEILEILNDDGLGEQGKNILYKYGIDTNNMQAIKGLENQKKEMLINSIISSVIFATLVLTVIFLYENKQKQKIENIITYIEEINNFNRITSSTVNYQCSYIEYAPYVEEFSLGEKVYNTKQCAFKNFKKINEIGLQKLIELENNNKETPSKDFKDIIIQNQNPSISLFG